MGCVDIVVFRGSCPGCEHLQDWRVQYRHGYCRQHEYAIGDRICWFDPPGREAPLADDGENVGGLVAVTGFLEACCVRCGAEHDAVVFLRDNVIERVELGPSEWVGEARQLEPSSSWMRFWTRRVAGSANEDRVELSCRGNRWTIVVADGAGGMVGGARAAGAAARAIAALGADEAFDADVWCERLRRLDLELADDARCGETTLVVVQVADGELWGASVGDSGALLVEAARVVDLTAGQRRKPLLGSGVSNPVAIARQPFSGRLLVATDGLLNYLPRPRLGALASAGELRAAVDALIQAVTLSSGALHDDVALVLGERTTALPGARGNG